jgi:hypothetical protein
VDQLNVVLIKVVAIALPLVPLPACMHQNSQTDSEIKRDNAEISRLLDEALLSSSPIDAFHALLSKVRSYPSVDSAWVNGRTFFVQYKGGGVVSWTSPPGLPTDSTVIKRE